MLPFHRLHQFLVIEVRVLAARLDLLWKLILVPGNKKRHRVISGWNDQWIKRQDVCKITVTGARLHNTRSRAWNRGILIKNAAARSGFPPTDAHVGWQTTGVGTRAKSRTRSPHWISRYPVKLLPLFYYIPVFFLPS